MMHNGADARLFSSLLFEKTDATRQNIDASRQNIDVTKQSIPCCTLIVISQLPFSPPRLLLTSLPAFLIAIPL
jgi:hypothetical protein